MTCCQWNSRGKQTLNTGAKNSENRKVIVLENEIWQNFKMAHAQSRILGLIVHNYILENETQKFFGYFEIQTTE